MLIVLPEDKQSRYNLDKKEKHLIPFNQNPYSLLRNPGEIYF